MSRADYVYQGQILWEKPDGSSEPITSPGKYDVAENETMVLTLQLPETYREQNLMIRSSLQDIRFYVDGKLRIEYDTSDTRIVGKILPVSMYFVRHQQLMPEKKSELN